MKTNIFFVLLFLFFAPVVSAQVTLKFNPEEKAKYSYKFDVKQNLSQQMLGQDMAITMNMSFTWDMTVLRKTTTDSEVEFTYRNILFLMDSPIFSFDYNSEIESENPNEMDKMLKNAFDAIIGKSITATITNNGEVTSVKGTEELMSSAVGAKDLGVNFDENSMKSIFEQSMKMYPNKPVNIGESWVTQQNMSQSGMPSLTINSTYTLKSVEKEIANIVVSSNISMSAGTGEQSVDFSGTQTGNIKMVVKTGMQSEGNIVQKLKGTLPNNIPLDLTSEVKISTENR